MTIYRENGGILLTPDMYIRNCWDSGLKLGLPENSLAQSMAEFLAQKNQNDKGAIIAVSDPRVERILATLNVKLGISMNLRDLPPIPANPIPDKLDKPVLILAKTTTNKLVKVQNITSSIDLQKVRNADGVKTPKGDYWCWMQGGKLYKGKCVNDATKLFTANERGGTCKEVLFLHLYYPESLNECFMDFAGSRDAYGSVPYLCRWRGGLELSARHPGDADPSYGSVSVGVSLDS